MCTESLARVMVYRTAAAARETGRRACKRHLPCVIPGSPEWNIHDDVASRVMRLTAGGFVSGMLCMASAHGSATQHLTSVASW